MKDSKSIVFLATVNSHIYHFHIPFMKHLRMKGYDVEAAAAPIYGFKKNIEEEDFVFHSIPFSRNPFHPMNFVAFFKLFRLLKKNNYRLIHTHTPVASFFGRFAAKLAGVPSVLYTAHGFHFFDGAPKKNWLLYYTAERLVARYTDALLVMNQEDFENGKKLGFVPGESLFLVHGVGVDVEKFSQVQEDKEIREELNISNDAVVVTCIAEFIKRKNHDFLLNAWMILLENENNRSLHLILVGDGILFENFKSKNLKNVHFLGRRSDVPSILNSSDIVTLTSIHEGLPRCIMEAMAAGKPVVATDIRGNRDLVKDGVNGYLVKLGDVEGLDNSIIKLANDEVLRKRMGEKGQEIIEAYSLENVLVEMEEIYDKFLK